MTLPVDPDILEIPFRTLGAAFTEFADRHPDKIAIHSIDQSASLTFGDLQRLTDRAAARMISDGVTRGDRVAILAGECIEKLVLMFAAWRCGASACPFHSEIAADHLASILKTIDPALVVWRRNDLNGNALTIDLNCPTHEFSHVDETEGYFADLPDDTGILPSPGTEYDPADEGSLPWRRLAGSLLAASAGAPTATALVDTLASGLLPRAAADVLERLFGAPVDVAAAHEALEGAAPATLAPAADQ